MKRQLIACAILSSAPFIAQAANPACQLKMTHLEEQIADAQTHNNAGREAGLQRALGKVRTYCTDAGLIQDQKDDIADQSEDIDEILQDIQEKQAQGRADKAKTLERKLASARAQLSDLQQELADLEAAAK